MAKKSTNSRPTQHKSRWQRIVTNTKARWTEYTQRSPHKSFRKTYSRDYDRQLTLPGYIAFTREVVSLLKQNWKVFGLLVVVYSLLVAVLVGFASQDTYDQLRNLLNDSGKTLLAGGWGNIGKAVLLLTSSLTGSLLPQLSDVQQVYNGFLIIFIWLTTIWLLRAILAGQTPKLRDAMYSSGAPLVPSILLSLLLLIQLIPLALAMIGYSSASASGLLDTGIEAMIFWLVAAMLTLLSLYWLASTSMALVIVTLPGMYPWKALRSAADLVMGRRLQLLLRVLWLAVTIVIVWIVIMLPLILIESWLSQIVSFVRYIPFIPVTLLAVSSIVTIWSAAYIYILYRKVVEHDAST